MIDEALRDERNAQASLFEQQADQSQGGMIREFAQFLATNKKWWLTPIVLVLMAFGALVFLGGTGAAPFIYTLF